MASVIFALSMVTKYTNTTFNTDISQTLSISFDHNRRLNFCNDNNYKIHKMYGNNYKMLESTDFTERPSSWKSVTRGRFSACLSKVYTSMSDRFTSEKSALKSVTAITPGDKMYKCHQ